MQVEVLTNRDLTSEIQLLKLKCKINAISTCGLLLRGDDAFHHKTHSFFDGESVVIKYESGTKQKILLYLIQNTIHTSSQI